MEKNNLLFKKKNNVFQFLSNLRSKNLQLTFSCSTLTSHIFQLSFPYFYLFYPLRAIRSIKTCPLSSQPLSLCIPGFYHKSHASILNWLTTQTFNKDGARMFFYFAPVFCIQFQLFRYKNNNGCQFLHSFYSLVCMDIEVLDVKYRDDMWTMVADSVSKSWRLFPTGVHHSDLSLHHFWSLNHS